GRGGADDRGVAAAAVREPGGRAHRVEAARRLGAEVEPAAPERGVDADRAEAAAAGPVRPLLVVEIGALHQIEGGRAVAGDAQPAAAIGEVGRVAADEALAEDVGHGLVVVAGGWRQHVTGRARQHVGRGARRRLGARSGAALGVDQLVLIDRAAVVRAPAVQLQRAGAEIDRARAGGGAEQRLAERVVGRDVAGGAGRAWRRGQLAGAFLA